MADHHQLPGPVSGSICPPQFVSSQFGDTTYTKVFVGGLAWETQNGTLRRHFEQYGEILEAVVITDKNTGRSKGYGFVTFGDRESARNACVEPNPVIDGRRANCNLASLGRLRPSTLSGRLQSGSPYFRSVQDAEGAFLGSTTGHQPVSYGYQQGYAFPSYGYMTYGPEYVYAQNVYSPYMGLPYVQMYRTPGTVNAPFYLISQSGQQLSSANGYPHVVQGYAIAGHPIVQLGSPNVNLATPSPFLPGISAPIPSAQTHTLITEHSQQFTHGATGSDQTTV
ncbi:uncharacterized protein LOC116256808 [Nymphaea colorata]|nr:uncharacterized protein LOC116256808 [Nymphaea colorata]XP_031489159.1 uncharacterized protein LOC116256808 [Nymphaea colorata]